MNKIDDKIVRHIFEEMENGTYPKFGSPEVECDKCMFFGVVCPPREDCVGCFGGWKYEKKSSRNID